MKHYQQIFSSPVYLSVLANTMKISLTVTFLCLVLGYPLAFLLATAKERTRNLIIIAVILPYFTSILVRSYAWLVLLGREGIINELLRSLGLIDKPIKMVYNTTGVLVGMTHILLPVMILSLYSVLRSINKDLMKVSESLGANRVQTFIRVFFPLSLPGVGAGCVFSIHFCHWLLRDTRLTRRSKDTMLSMLIATQVKNFSIGVLGEPFQ